MIFLKNTASELLADPASYTTAALALTIPANNVAFPAAQITFEHTGTTGYWYIKMNRSAGPTTSSYSRKLGPGETHTEKDPPSGEVWLLADGSVDNKLAIYAGWKQ